MRTLPLIAGSLAALLCGIHAASAAEPSTPPPRVVAAPVRLLKEASPKRYVGSVESIHHVDLMPRVTGTLRKVHFTEGDPVKKGELLYELEDTSYRASVDALKAQREALEAALRYADVEYRRSSKLLLSKAVAVSAHDKALLEINSARAKLKEINASLIDAENNLSYTKIHAPISGRIGKNVYSEGNLISVQGGKLNDIAMIAPIYVRFSLSERVFRRDFGGNGGIRARARVRVLLADGTMYPETAKVTLIDNKVNPATNTVMVWATFANRDQQLLPGSFATVLVSAVSDKPFTGVPASALIAGQNGYSVYVLDPGNKVVRREVKTGNCADGCQIILSGLDGSERVIVDGTHKVRPGMTVTPVAPAGAK